MNFSQSNQYSQQGNYYPNKGVKANKNLYQNTGYGSSGSSIQNNNNYNFGNNINNSQKMNLQNNNGYPPQNYHYPIEDQGKEKERPLWSYREIKYDEFKEPLNTEEETNKKLEKPEYQPQIPRKTNLAQLQDEDGRQVRSRPLCSRPPCRLCGTSRVRCLSKTSDDATPRDCSYP